ncbi:MAG TPA: CD225/dispanin family protein [Phycisphaerae bacterium]|nr:CD225/dispanin family protein [Phycisphaerae bacterium]HRW55195.1 CD225/dispanin family protein [Phycisphaerae bacterium]
MNAEAEPERILTTTADEAPRTPPTSPPDLDALTPAARVVRTHRRFAIIATCLMLPVGVIALLCSYAVTLKLAGKDIDGAQRWSELAYVLSIVATGIGLSIVGIAALLIALEV